MIKDSIAFVQYNINFPSFKFVHETKSLNFSRSLLMIIIYKLFMCNMKSLQSDLGGFV